MIDAKPTYHLRRRAGMFAICGVLLVIGLMLASLAPVSAASNGVTWEKYDVTIDVQANGDLHVVERQVVRFDGRFSKGFANIPLHNLDSIENVQVAIGNTENSTPLDSDYLKPSRYDEDPGTYTTQQSGGTLEIDYGFKPTSTAGSEERLVVLEYDVIGALRVYDDIDPANQQLWWTAISSDVTAIAPIDEATVTVTLPQSVAADQIVAFPEGPTVDGASYTWTKTNLGEGDDFELRLQFPPITTATAQDWQARDDQIRKDREEASEKSAVAGVFLLAAGFLLAIVGGVGLYAIWYTLGRDPQVGPVAEYLTEPPDDLGPGAAGTLIDEVTNSSDIISSVLDLARRGVLDMQDKDGKYTFTLKEHQVELDRSEKRLLDAIFGLNQKPGDTVRMSDIQKTFVSSEKEIHEGYYDELVDHKYFMSSPASTRARWGGGAFGVLILTGGIVVAILIGTGGTTKWMWFPIVVGVILFFAFRATAKAMPRKTLAGAEAAAKWRAFKTYLSDIEKYQKLDESKEIFDKYLPYATAFGLESNWVAKFSRVDTQMPEWFGGDWTTGPTGMGGSRGRGYNRGGTWVLMGDPFNVGKSGGQRRSSDGGSSDGGVDIPDLQDMSDASGRSVQSASDSFFGMLETAAKAFGAASSSGGSKGSWGGSGRSGGGFSGGGSRGGSSGGGKRGFG